MLTGWSTAALLCLCWLDDPILADAPKPEPMVLQVAADGSAQYRSIQAAIDAAPDYGVIRIAPGTYSESLSINKHLTLEGSDCQKTHVAGRWIDLRELADGSVELPPERKARLGQLIQEIKTKDGDRYAKALETLWWEFGSKPTLKVQGARVVLRGLRFSMLGPVQAGGWTNASMIDCENATGRIENCAFVGSAVGGWQIRGATDLTFRDSLFAGIRISAIDAELPVTSRLTIDRCEVRSIGYRGLQIKGAGHVEISHCRLAGGGVSLDGLGGDLQANMHHNLVLAGMSASLADRVMIDHNTFVKLPASKTLFWKPTWAMHLVDSSKPTVTNNLIVGFQQGIMVNQQQQARPTLTGNVFDVAGTPLARMIVQNAPAQGNETVKGGYTMEEIALPEGNVRESVQFMDVARGDFTLPTDPPLPIAGVGAVDFHGLGKPRPEAAEEHALWAKLTEAEAAKR